MAITKDRIKKIVEPHLADSQLFLVEVLVKQGNTIIVILDGDEAVTIDNCVAVSRHIEKSLDRDMEDFELKVMSAGADVPFRDKRQYQKNIGKNVKLLTKENVKYEGRLIDFDREQVLLELIPKMKKGQKPGKNRLPEQLAIPLSEIQETKRMITF